MIQINLCSISCMDNNKQYNKQADIIINAKAEKKE